MTTRRGFLGSILAAAVAPAIVRADSLMRIIPRETTVLPALVGGEEGSLLIQWIADPPEGGSILSGQEFTAAGTYIVPTDVTQVWVTALRGGGGGTIIPGKMISPTRDDRGQIFQEPMIVKPGQSVPIIVPRSRT